MSVPLHRTDRGVPVGAMFVGRPGDEAILFRLAPLRPLPRSYVGAARHLSSVGMGTEHVN
jgi:hypothetical protein